jgi:hypothetical protein
MPQPPNLSRSLLKLLNLLADFDGELSAEAVGLLDLLRHRSDTMPPLYTDVFGLPTGATCRTLVSRIETLSPEQRALASYAFQIFRSYEQMLRVQPSQLPQQQAAYESQLEQVRQRVATTRQVLADLLADSDWAG